MATLMRSWMTIYKSILFVFCLLTISIVARADETAPSKKFVKWLKTEMHRNQIPAVSIAVIKDYKVEWAMGFGVSNIMSEQAISDTTLFQAGSLSKPVTAMATLKAVQDGKLDLDDDINSLLKTWKLPENQLTQMNKVTLAQLLSHSAGTNVSGFICYASGETVPTIIQVLNGTSPAHSAPVRVDYTPGQKYQYSGGGYAIIQLALSDAYHKPFADLMDDLVLSPLGMSRSTFSQPLPASLADQIAIPYRPNYESVPGGPHTYPEQAAAGLWTTPFDLAKFTISLQESLRGDPNQILQKDYAKFMVTPEIDHMGLGFMVNVDKYGNPVKSGRYFMHGGQNEGYRSILIANAKNGTGAIIMTNMTPDGRLVMSHKITDSWAFLFAVIKQIADSENWR